MPAQENDAAEHDPYTWTINLLDFYRDFEASQQVKLYERPLNKH